MGLRGPLNGGDTVGDDGFVLRGGGDHGAIRRNRHGRDLLSVTVEGFEARPGSAYNYIYVGKTWNRRYVASIDLCICMRRVVVGSIDGS